MRVFFLAVFFLCSASLFAQENSRARPEASSDIELKENRVFYEEIEPLRKVYAKAEKQVSRLLLGRPTIGENSPIENIDRYIKLSDEAIIYINTNGLFGIAAELDRLSESIGMSSSIERRFRERIAGLRVQIEQARTHKNRIKIKSDERGGKELAADKAETLDRQEAAIEAEQGIDDDFWSGGGGNRGARKTDAEQDADFWSGISSEIELAKDSENFWSGESEDVSAEDGFWEGKSNGSGDAGMDYEIKYGDAGTRGVVSTTGSVLIPFRHWEILSFKSGMARVRKPSGDTIYRRCKARPSASNSNFDGYYYSVTPLEHGVVDKSGDWVIPPSKRVSGDWGKSKWFGLTMTQDGTTAADIRRAKAEKSRRMRACRLEIKSGFKSAIQRYISQGYQRIQ